MFYYYLLPQQQHPMINGLYLSEMDTVSQAQKSHYRNLNKIINSPGPKFTQQQHSILDVIDRRRNFHQRWKRFKTTCMNEVILEKQINVSRQNRKMKDRIKQIMMRGSRYHFYPDKDSLKVTRAHEFYRRKKMEQQIDRDNPQIAKRIIQAHGSIDLAKSNDSFKESRKIVYRMQRYPVAKRMMEYSEKKIRQNGEDERLKTQGIGKSTWKA